ncbi:MAG: glutamate dehydrogenase, partial [Acidobacteriota bacterium]
MSDSSGFIHDPDGIDEEKLAWLRDLKVVRRGRIGEYVERFSGARFFADQRPWGVKVDLAFPSATQNELNEKEARTLIGNGCRGVCEGANMPSTTGAVAVFHDAKILFGPGKAANAGGVAVSGLEQSQNSLRLSWSGEEVDRRLRGIMGDIHSRCVEHGEQDDGYVDYVRGANVAGFLKVADAMLAYGVS